MAEEAVGAGWGTLRARSSQRSSAALGSMSPPPPLQAAEDSSASPSAAVRTAGGAMDVALGAAGSPGQQTWAAPRHGVQRVDSPTKHAADVSFDAPPAAQAVSPPWSPITPSRIGEGRDGGGAGSGGGGGLAAAAARAAKEQAALDSAATALAVNKEGMKRRQVRRLALKSLGQGGGEFTMIMCHSDLEAPLGVRGPWA
jgi:hypothetical protein